MSLQTRLASLITTIKGAYTAHDVRIAKLEDCIRIRETRAGRYQMRTNDVWVPDADDNFGSFEDPYGEQSGNGATPIFEWEHIGVFVKAGSTVRTLEMVGRGNNTQIADVDLYLAFQTPDAQTRWQTGFDNDGEVNTTLIMRDFWLNSTDPGQPTHTGAINDMRQRKYDLNFVAPSDGWLHLYAKATGNVTANRYFIVNKSYLIEEPI